MISLGSLRRIESKYFPKSIEALIEQDLRKLREEKQEVVEERGNEQWQEDGSDVDSAESISIGPTGSDYEDADDEYLHDFEDEDLDAIILGVRIYTRGVAVSVTGDVVEQMIISEEDEDEEEDRKLRSRKGINKVLYDYSG